MKFGLPQSWTIGRKLWALSLFTCALLVVSGVIEHRNSGAIVDGLNDIGQTQLPAVRYMTLTDMMHDGIRAVVYKALLAGELGGKTLAEADGELQEFSKNINSYIGEISKLEVTPETKKAIDAARPRLDGYLASASAMVEAVKAGRRNEALAKLPAFNESFESLEGDLGKLGELIESNAEAGVKAGDEAVAHSERMSVIIILGGVLVCLGASAAMNRSLVSSLSRIISGLSREAERLGESSEAINRSSLELSTSSSEQASAIQETAASLEEITAMVAKSSGNSASLKSSVDKGTMAVETGQRAVGEMLTSMDVIDRSYEEIREQVEAGNKQIEEIVRVISEIGDKTKVINDIVFQTKLLSFNASVEAARAGEHGKGFAVVAEEVGNLAQMSGTAAQEISGMLDSGIRRARSIVEDSRERVERLMQEGKGKIQNGSLTARDCGSSFEAIVVQMRAVSQVASELAVAIDEQSKGLNEINKAVSLFDRSNQSNAGAAERAAATAAELLQQFSGVSGLVQGLSSIAGVESGDLHGTGSSGDATRESESGRGRPSNVVAFRKPERKPEPARDHAEVTLPAANDSRFRDF